MHPEAMPVPGVDTVLAALLEHEATFPQIIHHHQYIMDFPEFINITTSILGVAVAWPQRHHPCGMGSIPHQSFWGNIEA